MTKVARLMSRIYSCDHMAKPELISGEIPPTRDIYRKTLNMALPSTIESVLIGFISMADTIMVGTLGPAAIAAVGITAQPRFIFLAVIMALNIGVTAIVARRKGEERLDAATATMKQALILSGVLSLSLTVLARAIATPLLTFAGAGSDIIDSSVAYFRLMMVGIPFTALNMTINAAQRGCGNTKISLRTNLTANIVNIIFNYLFINGKFGFPALGVEGAALATVIGNVIGFLMSVFSVTQRSSALRIWSKAGWRFEKKTMHNFVTVGGNSLVEQLIMRFGFFMFVKVVASLGTFALSTHQICMNLMLLCFSCCEGLGVAASALIGQSLGAGRPDLAIIHGKVCQRVALTLSVLISIMFVFGRRLLISLFTSEQDIIALGSQIMLVIAVISVLQMSQIVISGSLRGAGDARYVAIVAIFTAGMLRPGAAFLLAMPFGLVGVWVGFLSDQLIRLIMNYSRFSKGKWVNVKL